MQINWKKCFENKEHYRKAKCLGSILHMKQVPQ
jgi:hypothetical protein